jgi:hypothetical protein
MRVGRAVFLISLATAIAPVGAAAAWQRQLVHRGMDPRPLLAFDGRGGGAAAWEETARVHGHRHHAAFVAQLRRGGAFGRPRLVGRELLVSGVSMDSPGHMLLLATRRTRQADIIEALTGSVSGRLRRSQTIAKAAGEFPSQPLLAADRRGDAIVVWSNGARKTMFSARVRGGRFSPPRAISRAGAVGVSDAMGANGHYVVSWARAHRVEARLGRGARLGRVRTLAPATDVTQLVPAAIDAAGDAIVAWQGGTQTLDIDFAYRSAGADFSAPERAFTNLGSTGTDIAASFSSPGNAVLAWDGADASGDGVFAEDIDQGTPDRAVRLSPPAPKPRDALGTSLRALAGGRDGRVAVAWTRPSTALPATLTGGSLYVNLGSAGGAFDPAEQVAPLSGFAADVALGFEPLSGDPLALLGLTSLSGGTLQSYTRR